MLSSILTAIGGALLTIVGLIYLFGHWPMTWLTGVTFVVLGMGLLLFVRQVLGREAGREARERTENQRLSRETDRRSREQSESRRRPEE